MLHILTLGLFGGQDNRISQAVNSNYQVKHQNEQSGGDFKRIIEEYDENTVEHQRLAESPEKRRTAHFVKVHKQNEENKTLNETKRSLSNQTVAPGPERASSGSPSPENSKKDPQKKKDIEGDQPAPGGSGDLHDGKQSPVQSQTQKTQIQMQ